MCRVLYMLQYAGACANTIVIVVANRVILIRRIAHFSFELFPFSFLKRFIHLNDDGKCSFPSF